MFTSLRFFGNSDDFHCCKDDTVRRHQYCDDIKKRPKFKATHARIKLRNNINLEFTALKPTPGMIVCESSIFADSNYQPKLKNADLGIGGAQILVNENHVIFHFPLTKITANRAFKDPPYIKPIPKWKNRKKKSRRRVRGAAGEKRVLDLVDNSISLITEQSKKIKVRPANTDSQSLSFEQSISSEKSLSTLSQKSPSEKIKVNLNAMDTSMDEKRKKLKELKRNELKSPPKPPPPSDWKYLPPNAPPDPGLNILSQNLPPQSSQKLQSVHDGNFKN